MRVTATHDVIPTSLESGQKLKRVKLITPVERVIQNNILKKLALCMSPTVTSKARPPNQEEIYSIPLSIIL